MNQNYIRQRIVQLSKELLEAENHDEYRRIKKQIIALKQLYKPSDPKRISDLMTGK
jgi:hypothetical protein